MSHLDIIPFFFFFNNIRIHNIIITSAKARTDEPASLEFFFFCFLRPGIDTRFLWRQRETFVEIFTQFARHRNRSENGVFFFISVGLDAAVLRSTRKSFQSNWKSVRLTVKGAEHRLFDDSFINLTSAALDTNAVGLFYGFDSKFLN